MKTPEQIIKEIIPNSDSDSFEHYFKNACIKAMQIYGNQKVEQSSQLALDYGGVNLRNKILYLKEKI